ncbi:BMP family lipoprotein [Nonomuraea glycinis]|uniref:BMP family lipoprotein n=1 Tax=Nonomuraea glycinis TaxID=2047744 RepID=UPI0033A4CAD5
MKAAVGAIRSGLLLVLLTAACTTQPEHAAKPVLPSTALHIGVAFDIGGRGDRSFSDSAARGIDRARNDLNVIITEEEASTGETDDQKAARLRRMADSGLNPIIAVGFAYANALVDVAPRYPNVDFAIIDDDSVIADNVANLVFQEAEGSFLVGVLAAQASKTDVLGFVGGVHAPIIERFEAGFTAGARAIKPKIVVRGFYLTNPPDFSGFTDPEVAQKAAEKLYAEGADVVYHAAGGSGLGVLRAAQAARRWAIGVDSDQYLQFLPGQREVILTSMIKVVDVAVYDYVRSAVAGRPTAGIKRYGLALNGVDYSTSNPLVTPYVAKAEKFRREILDGRIDVPTRPERR